MQMKVLTSAVPCWPSPTREAGKQKLVRDADFLKNSQLISSLALITLKNHFRPPLEAGGNSCSIPICRWWKQGVAADSSELAKGLKAERNRHTNNKVACRYQTVIVRLWLAGPSGPDKKSSYLIGWKKTAHTPQEAWESHIPPVGQPHSAGKICNFPTPGTQYSQYSHKASNISVRQSGSSSSIGRAGLSQPHLLVWHSLINNLASVALGKKRKRKQLIFWLLI